MLSLSILELKKLINTEMTMVGDIYEGYSTSTQEGSRVFLHIIKKALREYSRRRPCTRVVQIGLNTRQHTFTDNFTDWVDGTIEEKDINIVPESIGYIKNGRTFIAGDVWVYEKPILSSSLSLNDVNVRMFFRHKLHYNFAPDGDFTEDSKIYYMDDSEYDFIHLVQWLILRVIKNTKDSVRVSPVEILSFLDSVVSEYQQEQQNTYEADLNIYKLWRK